MTESHIGSEFDDYLKKHGIFEEITAAAAKEVIAYQLAVQMQSLGVSKAELARRMNTSRSSLDRLLDPSNSSVTLLTLQRAAEALGGSLTVELSFQAD